MMLALTTCLYIQVRLIQSLFRINTPLLTVSYIFSYILKLYISLIMWCKYAFSHKVGETDDIICFCRNSRKHVCRTALYFVWLKNLSCYGYCGMHDKLNTLYNWLFSVINVRLNYHVYFVQGGPKMCRFTFVHIFATY